MSALVSICVQTYQHGGYIRECLDGILMQKTDFSFEILLGEDCSTDGTREICIEYAKKYPDVIHLTLHERKDNISINGRPSGRFNLIHNLASVHGKYFAVCDGDDYWSDRNKLQHQVEFLEGHPDFALCFHSMNILEDNRITESYLAPEYSGTSSIIDLARVNYIYTASSLCRNYLPETIPDFFRTVPFMDYVLHMYISQHGKIAHLPERMAIYRIHANGIWSGMNEYVRLQSQIQVVDVLVDYYRNDNRVLRQLKIQRLELNLKLMELYRNSDDLEQLQSLFCGLVETDPVIFLDYLEEINGRSEVLYSRLARINRHPVSGRVIRMLAKIKRDSGFSGI